jgi:hypothetical protein
VSKDKTEVDNITTKEDANQEQIQRLLQSRTLRASATQRELLVYLAEKSLAGQAHDLKEYSVGVDALAKPETYDPRQDSSVRMHSARLRQKLGEYYRTEGTEDPIIIDLPKGGFKLTFEARPSEEAIPSATEAPNWLMARGGYLIAAFLVLVSCSYAIYSAIRLNRVEAEAKASTALPSVLAEIWHPLLGSDRPLALCLSAPMFVGLSGSGLVSGPFSGNGSDSSDARQIATLKQMLKVPEATPTYGYTDVSTAIGAFRLGQFFAGRPNKVLVTRSDLVSLPELGMDNVIFLGSPRGNPRLQSIPVNRQFTLDANGVRNLSPGPGQPSFMPDTETGSATGFPESHALITMAPGTNGSGYILYLVGTNESSIMAAVESVTEPALANKVFARLRGQDGKLPRYYQLVLTVKTMEDMPIDISYTVHKDLSTQSPGGH